AATDFDADRMPAPVLLRSRWISEVVLLAQLVGDVRGCGIQVARVPHDLGAAAAVVRHVAQRDHVDAIVVGCAAARPATTTASAAGRRRLRPAWPSAAATRRKWKRNRRSRWWPERRLALAVDTDGVDEHLAFANHLLDVADAGAARGVVAVRNHQQRLLPVHAPL